jgi:hypothetical protein
MRWGWVEVENAGEYQQWNLCLEIAWLGSVARNVGVFTMEKTSREVLPSLDGEWVDVKVRDEEV